MSFKPKGAFLAGGAITSTFTNKPIADYDLYFQSREAFENAVKVAYEEGLWCVCNSGRAITFSDHGGPSYQLMHFAFFESARLIFDSFDFTCCMAAVDIDAKEFVFHPTFLSDTSKRELVFNHRTSFPLASALRVLKYQGKGFTIRKAELLKVITACSLKPISGWDDLAQQIGGQYGQAAAIDKSKPFCLDSAISSLDSMGEFPIGTPDGPGSAEEALAQIFGKADAN